MSPSQTGARPPRRSASTPRHSDPLAACSDRSGGCSRRRVRRRQSSRGSQTMYTPPSQRPLPRVALPAGNCGCSTAVPPTAPCWPPSSSPPPAPRSSPIYRSTDTRQHLEPRSPASPTPGTAGACAGSHPCTNCPSLIGNYPRRDRPRRGRFRPRRPVSDQKSTCTPAPTTALTWSFVSNNRDRWPGDLHQRLHPDLGAVS